MTGFACRMTEEATNGDASPPNVKTMGLIARQALLLLEHLLTHGPWSVAAEFQKDRDAIARMATFQHIDEKGYPSSQISLTFIVAVAVTLTRSVN